MSTTLACLRCSKLAAVIIHDEYGDEIEDVADISAEDDGMLATSARTA